MTDKRGRNTMVPPSAVAPNYKPNLISRQLIHPQSDRARATAAQQHQSLDGRPKCSHALEWEAAREDCMEQQKLRATAKSLAAAGDGMTGGEGETAIPSANTTGSRAAASKDDARSARTSSDERGACSD